MKHLILVVNAFNVSDELRTTCCHVVANLALELLPVDHLHVKIELRLEPGLEDALWALQSPRLFVVVLGSYMISQAVLKGGLVVAVRALEVLDLVMHRLDMALDGLGPVRPVVAVRTEVILDLPVNAVDVPLQAARAGGHIIALITVLLQHLQMNLSHMMFQKWLRDCCKVAPVALCVLDLLVNGLDVQHQVMV